MKKIHPINQKNLIVLTMLIITAFLVCQIMLGCSSSSGGGSSQSNYSPTPTSTPLTSFEPDTDYQWQVEAWSNEGICTEGSVWNFRTGNEVKLLSGNVTPEMAEKVALNHLRFENARIAVREKYGNQLNNLDLKQAFKEVRELKDSDGLLLGYVFHLAPTGYIIVPSRKGLTPVIAYSYTTDFSWEDVPSNILLKMVKADLQLRISALDKGEINRSVWLKNSNLWTRYLNGSGDLKLSGSAKEIAGPLFKFTTWNQRAPYNDNCPSRPNTEDKAVVGCTAVTVAQIVNYWQQPTFLTLSENDSYESTSATEGWSVWIDAPEASYSNINFNGGNPNDTTKASICYACSALVKSNFGINETYAYITVAAAKLKERLGYKHTTYKSFTNNAQFDIQEHSTQIYKKQPFIIHIRTSNTGHAVNVDGYDSTNKTFHVSFGWGGKNDGWYSIPDGLPNNYTIIRESVIDIYPDEPIPSPSPTPSPDPSPTPSISPSPHPSPVPSPSPTPEQPDPNYSIPANGEQDVSISPNLHWSDCKYTDYYKLYIWKNGETKPSKPTASTIENSWNGD